MLIAVPLILVILEDRQTANKVIAYDDCLINEFRQALAGNGFVDEPFKGLVSGDKNIISLRVAKIAFFLFYRYIHVKLLCQQYVPIVEKSFEYYPIVALYLIVIIKRTGRRVWKRLFIIALYFTRVTHPLRLQYDEFRNQKR